MRQHCRRPQQDQAVTFVIANSLPKTGNAGLLLAFAGWLSRFFPALPAWLGWGAMAAGGLMVIASLIRRNDAPHTTLRDRRQMRRDWLILLLFAAGVMAFVGPAVLGGAPSLFWSPYPALTLPAFDFWLGVALLVFVSPIVIHR